MQTEDTDKQDQEIQALLKDYPMPQATATFYDRALARATHEGTRRQRKRWVMAGFASAVAAGLAFWLIGGFFLATPILPDADPGIPGITMTLEEPRTVNLMFPDGIELAGFPGQREITWQTSLSKGKNLLPLELIAVSPGGGEVLARLEHKDRDRTFRLRIDVS
jgi:hypothetical protein